MLATIELMRDSIHHRGPDEGQHWIDERAGIALGFRRLSIVDLSANGSQPMQSSNGRYLIVFNGEVYNHNELRGELKSQGHDFRGTSDTEVLLAAFLEWGIQEAVKRFNGMFSIALWDSLEKKIYLIRDRLGIKPLYYGIHNGNLFFASELKALVKFADFQEDISNQALTLYLRYGYIPAPFSIYNSVKKVMPGTILEFNTENGDVIQTNYWSMREAAMLGQTDPFQGNDQEAILKLERLLKNSVRERMIADVPLGAFLSGGIDSSIVVALMQAQSRQPVKTFTIGFQESIYNEAEYANTVAKYLRTDHTELYVSSQDALNVIPKIPEMFDEPFGDSSQIPTYLVSMLARRSVTVSLSGDGGDELFGGYSRYHNSLRVWNILKHIPARFLTMAGTSFNHMSRLKALPSKIGTRLYHLNKITKARTADELYWLFSSNWENPAVVVKNASEPAAFHMNPENVTILPDFAQRMMYIDLNTYLPDDILVKLDRASMAASLEGRVPLLDDHRIVEFALSLPVNMKIRSGQGKWLLKQVLYKYIPQSIMDRPKMGFGVPLDIWLRGPLRDWAESLLNEKRLSSEGYFNPSLIRQRWSEHITGTRNWQYPLWYVLMFQSWVENKNKRS